MSQTSRYEQLRALIEHKNTPEHERAAAQRMLDRLMAKRRETDRSNYDDQGRWRGAYGGRAYGAKASTEYAPATEIAKWMRADIKIARKVANAPAEDEHGVAIPSGFAGIPKDIKITVSTDSGSMHSSININIRNIPPAWGWYTVPLRGVYDDDQWEMKNQPSPELLRLVRDLEEIHWSYNWNGSDSMTDYFDVRYYGGVHLVTDERVTMPRRVDDASIAEAAEWRPPSPVAGVEDYFHRHVIPHFSSIELEPVSGDPIMLQARTLGETSAETDLGTARRVAYRVVSAGRLWFSGEYDWTVALPSPGCPPAFYQPLIAGLARQARLLAKGKPAEVPMSEHQAGWLRDRADDLAANNARWRD